MILTHLFNEKCVIFLLHIAQTNSNSPWSFQGFRPTLRRKYQLDLTTDEEFLHRPPLYKSLTFDVTTLRKVSNFYNGGLWGNSPSVVKSNWYLRVRVGLKPWNDHGKFEFIWAMCNKNIAHFSLNKCVRIKIKDSYQCFIVQ